MASERDSRPTLSPYASPIWTLAFHGGGTIYAHRDILQKAPGFFEAVLAARNEDGGSSLNPLGITDAEKWLDDFETAVNVYRCAMAVDLPSLGNLAYQELIAICKNLSLPSISQTMEKLRVRLDEIPGLISYLRMRVMSESGRLVKMESDALPSDPHSKSSSHQIMNLPIRPHSRIQKGTEDPRVRDRKRSKAQTRIKKEKNDALMMRYLEENTQSPRDSPTDRLTTETDSAEAEAEEARSVEKSQQEEETSAEEIFWTSRDGTQCVLSQNPMPPTGNNDFITVSPTEPPSEGSLAAGSDSPEHLWPPVLKIVSDDWDVLKSPDGSENSDDSRTLSFQWSDLTDEEESNQAWAEGMRLY
ncbi:hypothetical protein ACHAPA_011005 [Fusarium lateritium]